MGAAAAPKQMELWLRVVINIFVNVLSSSHLLFILVFRLFVLLVHSTYCCYWFCLVSLF
jgi:hypothetical protein